MNVQLPNLEHIRKKDPRLYETIRAIQQYLPPASQPAPPPVTNVSVASNGDGTVDVTFADSGAVTQQVNYFVEHAADATFFGARQEDFGASRNGSIRIGSTARAFRVFSQYRFPPSPPSEPVVFGGAAATLVGGGGSVATAPQASTGSGTASSSGQQSGQGFGKNRVRKA
ncbi:MAG: hypothetical protein ACRD8A_12650 [Candidatus Acidiferrales bacterium]